MRFGLFFGVIIVLLSGLGYYVQRRAAVELNLSARGRKVVVGVLVAGLLSMFAPRVLRGVLPEWAGRALGTAGSVVMLAVLLTAVLLALVDIPRALARLVARLVRRSSQSGAQGSETQREAQEQANPQPDALSTEAAVSEAPVALSKPTEAKPEASAPIKDGVPRRTFLSQAAAGSAFLIGGGTAAYGALFGRHDYVTEEVPVRIPGLPKALDGYTIAQLSDIHIGLYVGEPELRSAEELVSRARADLIVLTGDLIDFDPRYGDALGRLVRRLSPLARDGVTAIPGNHDYFAGIDGILAQLKGGGADVLRNRGRVIGDAKQGFALLGVDDVWAERMNPPQGGPDLAKALASVPRDLPRVLLCHNPVFFPTAAGEIALQLSGHTHGGQVNPLVRPADWVLPHGYVAGLYERNGSRLYVNRGFGTAGPPARIGSPPEVTKLVLVAA